MFEERIHSLFLPVVILSLMSYLTVSTFADSGRNEFENANSSWRFPSNFSDGFSSSMCVDLGVAPELRIFDGFSFVAGTSRNGVENDGEITLNQFILGRITDRLNFRVEGFRAAYNSGQQYGFVDQVVTIDAPDNPDFAIPYDTSGTIFLYRLDFNDLHFEVLGGEEAIFFLIADPIAGEAGDFELVLSNSTQHTDFLDVSFDEFGMLPFSDFFDTPLTSIAVTVVCGDGKLTLGDVNQDGLVNLLDVEPFVMQLSNGTFQAEADINQDGIVNLLDVGPFVALLTGG